MDSKRYNIEIWTDGSCTTKGRKEGGYGVYCVCNGQEYTVRRGYWNTTTSRMEMMALLEAIQMVNPNVPTRVLIHTDSQFVANSFNDGWLANWKREGWLTTKNKELWQRIDKEITLREDMKLRVEWGRGHQKDLDDPVVFGNNVADKLANYKTQEKHEQDLDLPCHAWYYHPESDCVFVDKIEHGSINEELIELGKCRRANNEELFDILNGTDLFESYWNQTLSIDFIVKNI